MFYDKNPELMYFTNETGAPPPTPNVPAPSPNAPTPATGAPITLPNITLPSPKSPLVLPGAPNPEGKPEFITLYQDISAQIQEYLKDPDKVGYLMMQATTAYTSKPVPNAKITISKPLGYNYFLSQIVMTDENGKTPPVPLPSRSAELSQQPGDTFPYTIYNLTAEAAGYDSIDVYDIPIFPGVTSIQPINFVPVSIPSTPETIYETQPAI